MFTVPPICRLGQPGYEGTCVMCRKVLYDDEDEEAPDEEMMECKDCRVSKRIPTEKIATALMSVGFPAPRLCAIERL